MNETTSPPARKTLPQRLGRLLRFVIFLCTAGWAFPHVCTEDMDLTKLQNDQSRGMH